VLVVMMMRDGVLDLVDDVRHDCCFIGILYLYVDVNQWKFCLEVVSSEFVIMFKD
jgi:hypothetical protein